MSRGVNLPDEGVVDSKKGMMTRREEREKEEKEEKDKQMKSDSMSVERGTVVRL